MFGLTAMGVLAVVAVAVRLFWVAFAPSPPVPEDVTRLNFGMTEDEVIGTLGRRPDGEWDRVTDDRESRVEHPDGTQFPPGGRPVRYLEWTRKASSSWSGSTRGGSSINRSPTGSQRPPGGRPCTGSARSDDCLPASTTTPVTVTRRVSRTNTVKPVSSRAVRTGQTHARHFNPEAQAMTNDAQCPRCGKELVVKGSFSTRTWFRPEELRLFSLSVQFPEVQVPASAAACAACGLVWTELDADVLRQKLNDLGNEHVRRRLGLLDES
jgi:hypothetical protein